MGRIRMLVIVMALLVMLCQTVFAQQAYVDLNARFAEQETLERDGTTYYQKNRVSTTLVLCANLSEEAQEGTGCAELIVLLPIDDDDRYISPVQLSGEMLASWLEGDDQGKTLNQLFDETQGAEEGCQRLLGALNALFPSAVIEHYAMLDLKGLPVLDGIENDAFNVSGEALVQRLKNIKTQIEQDGGSDVGSMLSDMSGYIVTDMKSGTMMKIVDKADRYDRSRRQPFPVMETVADSEEPLFPDLEAFDEMMLSIYYDDTSLWGYTEEAEKEN